MKLSQAIVTTDFADDTDEDLSIRVIREIRGVSTMRLP
jgi:hypothetical protein